MPPGVRGERQVSEFREGRNDVITLKRQPTQIADGQKAISSKQPFARSALRVEHRRQDILEFFSGVAEV